MSTETVESSRFGTLEIEADAIIEFPSAEAALAVYGDPAYEPLRRLRQASTRNVSMVLARAFAVA